MDVGREPDSADAKASADVARASATDARAAASEARDSADEVEEALDALLDPQSDPLVDEEVRHQEAGVDEDNPLGVIGRPISRRSPFVIGFTAALGVATAYLLVQALAHARAVLLLLLVSLFLALGLDPVVMALERRGLSRKSAIGIVFAAVIGVFIAFAAAIVPPVAHQISNLTNSLPDYINQLQQNKRVASLDSRFHLLQRAKDQLSSGDIGTRAVGGVLGVGKLVLSTTLSLLTVLILTLYLLGSLPSIRETAYRMAPRTRRARVKLLGDEMLAKVGGYVAGALAISVIAGAASFIFLLIIRAPYPLALAMIVMITDLIPLIGATIGALAVTAVCLVTSIPAGIAAFAFFFAYQQIENYLIYPRIMGRTVDVSPAATIVAALIGGALLGVFGALLAIPTAAALSLVLREIVMPRQDTT